MFLKHGAERDGGFVQKVEEKTLPTRKILNTYIRNLIWNKYRLCWILPSEEGTKFFEANFPGKEVNNVEQEDGNLELFPRYPNFQPAPRGEEKKEHKEQKERKYEAEHVEQQGPHARQNDEV